MPSRYPHGYQYDLFVSYSSRDLTWVEAFHKDLVEDVNRFVDFDVCTFFDKVRLQPGFIWDNALQSAASESALLIPVMSHRFFQSDYCQKELKAFVDACGTASASSHRSRILPVKLLCSAPADHPLAQVQATSFCADDNEIPFEHQPGSEKYKESLRKLAVAIAQLLTAVPPRQQNRARVYVAPDFKLESDKLRASLSHHFHVLPENPHDLLTLSEAELQQSLQRDFARCFVSVHPLAATGIVKALVDTQLEFARTQNKPRLIWTPERRDDLTNAGFEWFTSQAEIEDRIRRLHEKPAETKASSAEQLIYFLCPDRANKTNAEPLLEVLERKGVHVYPSPLDGAADHALQTHVSALDELDGCLIYYGDVERDWFDAVFLRVQKKIRQRGLLSAIFLAPPKTQHKMEDLRSIGVPLVEEPEAAVRIFQTAVSGATP